MATNAIKYISPLVRRGYAAQAAVSQAESTPSTPEIKCTIMPNKLLVSSLDLCGPLARVSIVFRTGPRNETPLNAGASHIIRSMTGLYTENCTGFAVVRNMQQNGAHFTCVGDRETTAFNVVATRDKILGVLKYLSAVVSGPLYKHWQLKDNLPRFKYEIKSISPQARVVDIFHKAAFRTGLGNSLFLKKDKIGTHTSEMLQNFYNESFSSKRASIAAYNINHSELLKFAKSLDLQNCDPPEGNSTYFGGEIRKDKNSYFAHVAIGTVGVGQKDLKESLVFSILQHTYGAAPAVKWGTSPSPLHKAVYSVANDAGVSCFNLNYSDTGLFGILISSSATSAGKAVVEAMKVLKSGKICDADVCRGKALLKMSLLSSYEGSETITEDMAHQALNGEVILPAAVITDAIEKISVSDVQAAAKKIASSKFTLAGFGNLTNVPYLDQLQ